MASRSKAVHASLRRLHGYSLSDGAGCTSPAPKNAPGMGAPFCLLVQVQMPTRPAAYVMPSHLLVPAAIWQHLPGSIGAALVHTAGRQWQDVTAHSVSQGPTSSTYIQFLLQEYRRNLGAVGSVFTQISQHFLPQETGKADSLATPSQNDAVSGASLDAALSSEVEPLGIADADLQVLASLLASFVSSGKKPGEQFLACCAARFQQLLGHEFNDTAVASVLEALAMFGYNPAPCHVDAAAAAISANLQFSSAANIAKMLAALAVFGHSQRPLLGHVAGTVVERISEFSPAALADIVYAYAMLGTTSEHLINAVLQQVLMGLGKLPRESLTQLVSALAMLGHKDVVTDVFLSAASDEISKHIDNFSGPQLSDILWSYTLMEQWGVADSDLMEAIIEKMMTLHKDLDGKDLVNLVRALADSQHQSPLTARLLPAVVQDVGAWTPQLNPERLARLLWGLASLRYYDAALYTAVARETYSRLDAFRPDHLTNLLLAWATMVHDPGEDLLEPLVARLTAQVSGMRARSICALLWSLAVLRRLSPTLFATSVFHLHLRPLPCFEHLDFERLHVAHMLLVAEYGSSIPPLPDWIRGYAESAWKDKYAIEHMPISCHVEVRDMLREAGRLTAPPPGAAPAPDIVFTQESGKDLAMRVVMPAATTVNPPYRQLASSVIITRLLQASGWTVVEVDKREWTCRDSAGRMEYLNALISEKV